MCVRAGTLRLDTWRLCLERLGSWDATLSPSWVREGAGMVFGRAEGLTSSCSQGWNAGHRALP